ncbi:MAG: kynureninase [Steroidobacteraceae bacterium]
MAWTREDALQRDEADPLQPLRTRFALPPGPDGRPALYLCGHSLGLMPIAARADVTAALDDWARLAVLGHEQGERPWITYHDALAAPSAELLGCRTEEIAIMNSLSVNLQLMLASFYRPSASRRCIVIEAGAFPSDRYAVATHLQWHGLDPLETLIEVAPRAGEDCVREEDIEALLARRGEQIALVLWPGVQYLTGQAFDLIRVARAARAAGAQFGVDLAHSVGNMPWPLRELDADFAVWCSYKYLNAGPGALAGCFVHQRHFDADRPRLAGWWGHELPTRFQMPQNFRAAHGAAGFQLSNQSVFAAAPLIASLSLFREAGVQRLREKSLALSGFLAELITAYSPQVRLITPRTPAAHGAQLSLRIGTDPARAKRVYRWLTAHGAICDWREPDIIRAAPAPLYNSFVDVFTFAMHLAEALRAA